MCNQQIVRRPPGDPLRGVSGGLWIFLSKSLVIPAICTKFKLNFVSVKLEWLELPVI